MALLEVSIALVVSMLLAFPASQVVQLGSPGAIRGLCLAQFACQVKALVCKTLQTAQAIFLGAFVDELSLTGALAITPVLSHPTVTGTVITVNSAALSHTILVTLVVQVV